MKKLHWLTVYSGIKYKLLVLTHLAYHQHTKPPITEVIGYLDHTSSYLA